MISYRRTLLGPFWLLVGPSLFIALLGILFAEIGDASRDIFIPHLAIGLITWTLVNSFIVGSATVMKRRRSLILQGTLSLYAVVWLEVIKTLLLFVHQLPILVIVFLIYEIDLDWKALQSLLALILLIVNGIWITHVFGILGARYPDLIELFNATMRIAFLTTPILWMPGEGMHRGVLSSFLTYNPFYHFIEIVRAPLLGNSPDWLSWGVAIGFIVFGFVGAWILNKRYAPIVPFWL